LLVGVSLVATFYAGQVVGAYNEHRKNELVAERAEAYRGVEEIKRLGQLSDMMRAGRTPDVERVLNLYVKLQAGSVKKCVADPVCSSLQLGSTEREAEIKRLLVAAGVTP
jgi:hypothetical protein